MAPSNWLPWPGKKDGDNTDRDASVSDPKEQNNEDQLDDEFDNDDNENQGDDEIADHVVKKKGWTFWNSGDVATSEAVPVKGKLKADDIESKPNASNDTKPAKEKLQNTSNRILRSTPSIPSIQDYTSAASQKNTSIDKANDSDTPTGNGPNQDQQDDAVLYKPHSKASQFNQINTHKNENLKENTLVPDWQTCLPPQSSLSANASSGLTSSSLATSLFGNSSTANINPNTSVMDLKNWRNFLHQLSAKLGFTSQQLTSVVENADDSPTDESDDKEKVRKEFNLLYERTYKLYGRSLAKLPNHKRACLPNYVRAFLEVEKKGLQQENVDDDGDEDDDNISITNDPMGNLLINHKRSYKNQTLKNPDIISQKPGPLQKIKKILIIGVHGFFPHRMIRPIIGAPKGTSLKFANEAEKGIIRYCIENGMITDEDSNSVSIQKIALEKEGKIFDRVEFFTEILSKWQQELNEADFIFVASHSQGCVVSIILLARLILMGILKNAIRKRIGILGMAGVNNGPFYGIDKSFFMKAYSTIEHDSLTELFELNKFDSAQSLAYKESIQAIVNANVKICFVGSVNDQLVPLYSALALHVFHPNIYRACYIDHSSQTPLFVQKLVSLCCHMQNLGYFDNNVLKELSSSLAGTMTGGGHSKLYNDGKVYDLGIRFVLDTDDIIVPSTKQLKLVSPDKETLVNNPTSSEIMDIPVTNQVYIKEYNISKIGTNPFILPWCLRGLLFSIEKNWPNQQKSIEKVLPNGYDEINELYESFESWKPETKIQKELKFKLNGIRASKL